MPFYEEKLISPLSVRFTQQRIREAFQDGREVESTIKEIKAMPGVGDYDVILQCPFPTIEIIRWAPNGRRAGGQWHWFSYDNRRLYCLQRVAAEYWPKRVGAIVEVMYADAGDIRKKLDTQTGGLSVSIGHAFALEDELAKWTWREAVEEHGLGGTDTLVAEAAIAADDVKSSVHDLTEAPAAPSAYERLMSSLEAETPSEIPRPEAKPKMAAAGDSKTGGYDRVEVPVAPSSAGSSSSGHHAELQTTQDQGEMTMPEEDLVILPAETPQPDGQSLTSLIGQLFESTIIEPEASVPEEDGEHQEQTMSPAEAPAPEDQSLAGLIGQFLVLKPDSAPQMQMAGEESSNVPGKTHSEDRTESATSDGSTMETSMVSLSSDESKAHKDGLGPVPKQKAAGKKAAKATQQAGRALRAAQFQNQRAQYQLAEWQMAQWRATQMQAAQMAHWQMQAGQAAQFQAYQAAQWQQGYIP